MSFLPDLTPLINQIKIFTQTQEKTNQILQAKITQDQTNSLLFLQELKEIKQLLLEKK